MNENEIYKAPHSVFPVIWRLGLEYHSYKSSVNNFLIIVVIFSSIMISQSWKEMFYKGPQKPSAHAVKISVLPYCYAQQEWN